MSTSTIDSNELTFFNEASADWWDKKGGQMLLHSMNELRVPLVRDGLIKNGIVKKKLINTPQPLKNLSVLEVGCGGGIFTEALAKLGCAITGIDLSPELITLANQHAALDPSLTNLKYLLESVEAHAVSNYEKYDAVVASEVLEHITEKELFLEACVKCIKPGGSIFITTENKTLFSWFAVIIFSEYIWRIVPFGTHHWYKFITPEDTQKILEKYKCRTKAIRGMLYNFLTNTWHWAWTNSVNYTLHAIKDN